MRLYDEMGWLNVPEILDTDYTFIFIIGARGVGKTYGILKYIHDMGITSMIMRRTQVQADIISNPAFHPYIKICDNEGFNVITRTLTKGVTGLFVYSPEEGAADELPFSYITALSTFANLRGFDASSVDLIFIDEFIPESNKNPIKNEYETMLNMYETVNRNRELEGEKPVKLVCAANSNTIDNPYFIGLGIVNKIYTMQRKGQNVYADPDRSLLVINLTDSPISEKKRHTALYRLAGNSSFTDMALDNEYSGYDEKRIRTNIKLIEYRPVFTVGEITFYKHKSDRKYHVSLHREGASDVYTSSTDDIARCKSRFAGLAATAFYEDLLTFESAACQILFNRYLLM